MAHSKSLVLEIFGKDHSASKTLHHIGNEGTALSRKFRHVGAAIAGAFAIEKVAEFSKKLVELASAEESVDTQLNQALKNAGSSFQKLSPHIEEADAKMRGFGFSNEDSNRALTSLTIGLHDPEQAMKALGVAANLARAKNLDLATASMLVMKGMEGQTKPMKALGIDLPIYAGGAQAVAVQMEKVVRAQAKANDILRKSPDAASKSSKAYDKYKKALAEVKYQQELLIMKQKSGDTILKTITERTKGAAAAAQETLSGKTAELRANFGALGAKLGKSLLPGLKHLADIGNNVVVPALSHIIDWIGPRMSKALKGGSNHLGGVARIFGQLGKGGGLASVAKQLAKVSPLFGILMAVAKALQPVLPTLAKAVTKLAKALVPVLPLVADLVIKLLPLLAELLVAIIPIIPPLVKALELLMPVLTFLVDWVSNGITLYTQFGKLLSGGLGTTEFLKSVVKLQGPLGDLIRWVSDAFAGLANGVIDGLNGAASGAMDFINSIRKGLGMGPISIPLIPRVSSLSDIHFSSDHSKGGAGANKPHALAAGAIVRRRPGGIQATIGEGVHDEAVIPLTRTNVAAIGGGGGGDTYIVNGFVGSPTQLAKALQRVKINGQKRGAISGRLANA